MLELTTTIEPIYPAATVVLVRDGELGLEALLVQRSNAVAHMGGMWVFPGGRVDEGDYPADRDDYRAALNAAVRETREEAGLEISAGQLTYLSHWTTPEGVKRRFATWFFLAVLEDGQEVAVDGGEISDHRWVRPEVVFAEMADQEPPIRMVAPTFVSLVDIADCESCCEAHERIAAREAIQYAPHIAFIEEGLCFLYGGDAGYVDGNPEAEGARHRTYLIDGRLEYLRQY